MAGRTERYAMLPYPLLWPGKRSSSICPIEDVRTVRRRLFDVASRCLEAWLSGSSVARDLSRRIRKFAEQLKRSL